MQTVTIRVTAETRELVHTLAEEWSVPMAEVVARAVDAYRRDRILDEANEAYAAMYRNPKVAEELARELDEWDATLADGLEGQ
ncbi:MAG: toxin-antitoxin system protein [Deferrisomatales bacterium]